MSTQIQPTADAQIKKIEVKSRGAIKIEPSLMKRAKNNEFAALERIFQQFLPENEPVRTAEYLGVQGLWGIGTLSFACSTDRRAASIRRSFLGELNYQDGCIEYINSGIIYQPSKFWLYLVNLILIVFALYIAVSGFSLISFIYSTAWALAWFILVMAIGIALMPLATRIYYSFFKCGLVFVIREGVSVYLFTDRNRMNIANRLYRTVMQARENRVREVGRGI